MVVVFDDEMKLFSLSLSLRKALGEKDGPCCLCDVPMRPVRSQSAMEYLMTYGWAILIIAVVLGALFGLGFFNAASLAPKVSAGACQVQRPQGPETTAYINLEGVCNNELPQYVASFNSLSYSSIRTGQTGLPTGASPRSVFAWVYFTGNMTQAPGSNPNSDYAVVFSYGNPITDQMSQLGIFSDLVYFDGFANNVYASNTVKVLAGGWHFIGYTYSYNSLSVILYMDNQAEPGRLGTPLNTNLLYANLGYYEGYSFPWYYQGEMANVQVYNASLSANVVTALYQEGIGGSPLDLQNLVAWWPLNGNANDYSGNLNNGVAANVVFTSSWTSGYSAP